MYQQGYGAAPQAYGQQQMNGAYAADPNAAKKQQKQVERQVRRERREKRQQAEGDSLVGYLCAATLFTSVLASLAMFGNSWASVSFVGAGVKMFSISTSLFSIDVDIQCGKNWLEDKLCAVIHKLDGKHSLHDAQQISCSMTQHACSLLDKTYYASFIIFFCHTLAIICNLCAALFLHYYWKESPTEKVKQWALYFFFFAPLSMLAGTFAWTCVCPDLNQLPMAWTHTTSMLTGGLNIFGYEPVPTFPYGWCWILSWLTFVLMSFQLLAWGCCFREHKNEDDETAREELEKLMMTDPAMLESAAFSGLPQAGVAPQYGAAQPYAAGSFQQPGPPQAMPPGGWR